MQVIDVEKIQVWTTVGLRSPAQSTLGQVRAGFQEAVKRVILRKHSLEQGFRAGDGETR